jgi:hypothetical protein
VREAYEGWTGKGGQTRRRAYSGVMLHY